MVLFPLLIFKEYAIIRGATLSEGPLFKDNSTLKKKRIITINYTIVDL